MAAANGERARQKFSDHGSEGHIPIENVYGCLGLIHAAASGGKEKFLDQESNDEACSRGHQQHPHGRWRKRGAEKGEANPFDGHAETDHSQSGKHSDNDRQQQE